MDDTRYAATLELAADAVAAGLEDDWPAARTAVLALNDLGALSLGTAIVAWCDFLIGWLLPPQLEPHDVTLAWRRDGLGPVRSADEVPPPVRWAGQLIAARAAMDMETFAALLSAPPPAELGDHIATLLQSVVMTMQGVESWSDTDLPPANLN